MHLTIDFETRSPFDIKKEGTWKYAENPFTEVMCLAVAQDMGPARLWVPYNFEKFLTIEITISKQSLIQLIKDADTIEAHNVEFEIAIWFHIMQGLGFPDLPMDKMRCSAAKAAIVGIPRSLGKACKALNLAEQKDEAGSKVMQKMCKPKKPTKSELKTITEMGWTPHPTEPMLWRLPDGTESYFWNEKPEDMTSLFKYCLQDVVAERALSKATPELSPYAYRLWRVDQEINRRGVLVDHVGCLSMIQMSDTYKAKINSEIQRLTDGEITKGTQVAQISAWLSSKGIQTCSLDAEAIDVLLTDGLPEDCHRLLELRREYAKSSVAKYEAADRRMQKDGRVRSMFMYHGAHTGRWAGKGVQLQNLPSRGLIKNPEAALELIKNGCSIDMLSLIWESPLKVASSCIRSVFLAAEGHEYLCVDYSAIEGRILAWLAGEQYVLDGYIAKLDPYKVAAAGAFQIDYAAVNKAQRQIGKVIELACGYQGWLGAFHSMAKNYGLELADDVVKETILKWRNARPLTVRLWAEVQKAAELAMLNPGKTSEYRNIQFRLQGQHLQCRLPSGRILWYPFAKIKDDVNQWGKPCYTISYMTEDSVTNQWCRKDTYGGKLVENCIARGTEVLTDSGWKCIENIQSSDRVHDGVRFVNHGGLVCKQEQSCVIINGVYMTPDHEVLTNDGWKTASQFLRHDRAQVRHVDCAEPQSYGRKEMVLAHPMRLRDYVGSLRKRFDQGEKERYAAKLWVPEVQTCRGSAENPRHVATSRVCSLEKYARQVQTSLASGVEKLWRAGHNCLRRMASVFSEFLERYGRRIQTWVDIGSSRQRLGLLTTELQMGIFATAGQQQEEQCQDKHTRRGNDRFSRQPEIRNKHNYNSLPNKSELAGAELTNTPVVQAPHQKIVYDILNCGPLRRFVVRGSDSPFIVHNCVQAISADIISNALILLAEDDWHVVMHIHDEVVSEEPIGKRSVEEMAEIICRLPKWADGLPITAEGWKGPRYKKEE